MRDIYMANTQYDISNYFISMYLFYFFIHTTSFISAKRFVVFAKPTMLRET